jgi:cyanophycinase
LIWLFFFEARLAQAIAAHRGIIGIGLSEDTGFIVERGKILKVIGSASVTGIDVGEAKHHNISNVRHRAAISNGKLAVSVFANSDLFDIKTK